MKQQGRAITPRRTRTKPVERVDKAPERACDLCQAEGPTRYVGFDQNIGFVVLRWQSRIQGYLCEACARASYLRTTLATLLMPWGVVSMIAMPLFVIQNTLVYAGVVKARPPEPAARSSASNVLKLLVLVLLFLLFGLSLLGSLARMRGPRRSTAQATTSAPVKRPLR
jgi:hypothetical protein